MKFKEGDKVRIIAAVPSTHNGENATFVKMNGLSYTVLLKKGSIWGCEEIESLVDKREQAIYKRLCNIKRPKPKVVMKFKNGSIVIIRNDLVVGNTYEGHCTFEECMEQYKGKQAVITECNEDRNGKYYTLDIDNREYSWGKDMFERVI